ncbi:HAD-like domain-containing protein [Podospora aff. communis PSN243]|uniref:Mitochondrial import inner membrane translocase subunit TIM50 n=1 Tax=Podospora aff. communis PSN243 TaxID=3040156 RepID=A0AAV9GZN8_9PEZI|nr:HAD-like domain-containing protein [Podospora aff. communis PSN243]
MDAARGTQRSLRFFLLHFRLHLPSLINFKTAFTPASWVFRITQSATAASQRGNHNFSSAAKTPPEFFTMAENSVPARSRRSRNRRNRAMQAAQQDGSSNDAAPIAPSFNMNPLANWVQPLPQFQPQQQQFFPFPGPGGNGFIPNQGVEAMFPGSFFGPVTGGYPLAFSPAGGTLPEFTAPLDESNSSTPAPVPTRQPPSHIKGKRAKRRWQEKHEGHSQPPASLPPPPKPKSDRDPVLPPSAESGGVPDPTPAYLLRASFLAQTVPEPRPILVVIDLNGTLLHRPSRHAPHTFVERPHARSFVSYCIDTFHVVIWSSARPDNVKKMCRQLLTPEQRQRVIAMWGRDKFGLTPVDYNSRVQCYKRLTTLWEDPLIASVHPAGGSWNQGNTVLIDDSTEKARSEPYNAITIPEFVGNLQENPEVLPLVHNYLNTLAVQADISTYIRAYPFSTDWTVLDKYEPADDQPGGASVRIDP